MKRTMTAMLEGWVLFLLVLVAVELGEEVVVEAEVETVEAVEVVEVAEVAETVDVVEVMALAAWGLNMARNRDGLEA